MKEEYYCYNSLNKTISKINKNELKDDIILDNVININQFDFFIYSNNIDTLEKFIKQTYFCLAQNISYSKQDIKNKLNKIANEQILLSDEYKRLDKLYNSIQKYDFIKYEY